MAAFCVFTPDVKYGCNDTLMSRFNTNRDTEVTIRYYRDI